MNFTVKMRAEEEKDKERDGGNKIHSRERKGVQDEQHLSEVSLMERKTNNLQNHFTERIAL